MSSLEVSDLKCSKGFELKCKCGLTAERRVSRTRANLFRLFYNCPKSDFADQCEFFEWADDLSPTGDKHLDEINEISSECRRLQERIDLIREEHDTERAAWIREREQLMSQLLSVKMELDQMKTRIKIVHESDLMPPYDEKLSNPKDEEDDPVVIQTV
ncbi:uncharacterized protein At4g04775-like [Coffea eugenioides]|uniref:Uncharacterized protein At4g04775-like n=1 Tax=Coffea arabica TaxID=13443 RepID=A0A6P6WC32_COFAR|nr:uncharacterized protein At4g04775-like [Coffea arabica]XP_027112585.1 uncharacterized protein At4g04775-like [Coffea arabica]XP_027162743.1 uncharacterized protein At4g04775-like [Coffea eugenioides]XP_027162744.1 uncharacterized protein At4g04775-like [Coffea eugenioides]